MPILAYVVAVVKYLTKQEDELNACWNSVDRSLFRFNECGKVKFFTCGPGSLDLHRIIRIQHTKFYIHVLRSRNMLLYK